MLSVWRSMMCYTRVSEFRKYTGGRHYIIEVSGSRGENETVLSEVGIMLRYESTSSKRHMYLTEGSVSENDVKELRGLLQALNAAILALQSMNLRKE